mmetsp:Transcript_12802/g.39328  ORF Transcript_12802/g.39328 Transcript_12802/m.39328 type:complete len:265 (-) Transcript_12802:197-991(-)
MFSVRMRASLFAVGLLSHFSTIIKLKSMPAFLSVSLVDLSAPPIAGRRVFSAASLRSPLKAFSRIGKAPSAVSFSLSKDFVTCGKKSASSSPMVYDARSSAPSFTDIFAAGRPPRMHTEVKAFKIRLRTGGPSVSLFLICTRLSGFTSARISSLRFCATAASAAARSLSRNHGTVLSGSNSVLATLFLSFGKAIGDKLNTTTMSRIPAVMKLSLLSATFLLCSSTRRTQRIRRRLRGSLARLCRTLSLAPAANAFSVSSESFEL